MGQRGPKPGQYVMRPMPKGSPAASKGASRYRPGAPACPSWLSKTAKKVFKRVVGDMLEAGTVANVDVGLIASYATAEADLAEVRKALNKTGVVIEVPTLDRNGRPTGHSVEKPNPLLRTQDALLGRVKQLADALGISPAARSRAGAAPEAAPTAATNKVIAIRDRIAALREAN
ncbi:phage terminase small subunit P27 family [Gemmata sp. G18]|uniref:Phage terminase small subunit P27 family n=1 Tax=Gemmata palustris TaxID=2822762 RepID=A0ABS5C0D3_9BACT|nr:phage terminase small subunit P27 family [Gemmata palustris]MBP3959444.1 phage terminase small subunit P27 family [Gemmata palustris]